jgi:hypothetical protein
MDVMLTESDTQLLEGYLDDALSPAEVQSVDARLSEPEVAAALDALRSERAARVAVFQSLTPGQEEADRFARNLSSAVRRGELKRRVLRGATLVAGLAACLMVGFAAGWFGRGPGAQTVVIAPPPSHPNVSPTTAPIEMMNQKGPAQTALIAKSTSQLAAFGLTVTEVARDDAMREAFPVLGTRPAICINGVAPNSPADKAGFVAGDYLLTLAGQPLSDISVLATALAATNGKTELQIMRGGALLPLVVDIRRKQ